MQSIYMSFETSFLLNCLDQRLSVTNQTRAWTLFDRRFLLIGVVSSNSISSISVITTARQHFLTNNLKEMPPVLINLRSDIIDLSIIVTWSTGALNENEEDQKWSYTNNRHCALIECHVLLGNFESCRRTLKLEN